MRTWRGQAAERVLVRALGRKVVALADTAHDLAGARPREVRLHLGLRRWLGLGGLGKTQQDQYPQSAKAAKRRTHLVARADLEADVLAHRRRRAVRAGLVPALLAKLGPVFAFSDSMVYDCLLQRALNAFCDLYSI